MHTAQMIILNIYIGTFSTVEKSSNSDCDPELPVLRKKTGLFRTGSLRKEIVILSRKLSLKN